MSNRLGFGWLALSCLLFLETGVATASDPEDDADAPGGLVEEFFQLESSHVQERGEWQLGITTQTDSNDDPEIAPLQLEAEYGVTDRWQLGVEIAYQAEGPVPGDESGWGNPSFGTQVELFSARSSVFSIAAEREVGDGEEEAWEAALLGSTRLAAVELSWIAASSLEDGLEEAELGLGLARAQGPLSFLVELMYLRQSEEMRVSSGVAFRPVADLEIRAGLLHAPQYEDSRWIPIFGAVAEF